MGTALLTNLNNMFNNETLNEISSGWKFGILTLPKIYEVANISYESLGYNYRLTDSSPTSAMATTVIARKKLSNLPSAATMIAFNIKNANNNSFNYTNCFPLISSNVSAGDIISPTGATLKVIFDKIQFDIHNLFFYGQTYSDSDGTNYYNTGYAGMLFDIMPDGIYATFKAGRNVEINSYWKVPTSITFNINAAQIPYWYI